MKKYAIIVAGGLGLRMNTVLPKQFLLLKNKPVLFYSINTFLNSYDDLKVILVLPEEHIAKGQEIIDGFFDTKRIKITKGGRTRFHSVKNGLSLIKDESIIFIHDGVRCLLTLDLIHRSFKSALQYGTAIPVIKLKEAIRIIKEDGNEGMDRESVRIVQTPQTFHSKILLEAYKIDYKEKFTDDASVVESFGLKIHLIEGEKTNIKITDPIDMIVAENILQERNTFENSVRIGLE